MNDQLHQLTKAAITAPRRLDPHTLDAAEKAIKDALKVPVHLHTARGMKRALEAVRALRDDDPETDGLGNG